MTMQRIAFYVYACGITLLPVVYPLVVHGVDSAFWLLTGDAYLYLGIATSSTADFFSFDGETATNGFHPMWQAYVWLVGQLSGSPTVLMNAVAWSAVLCVLIGVLLLGESIFRGTRSWLLAGLATPGVYFLAVGQGLGNLSVWDFFNGMEAGLSLAVTGVISWLIVGLKRDERRPAAWLTLGTAMGFLMLVRLDDVFVIPAVGLAWLFWEPAKLRLRLKSVALLWLPPTVFLGFYFAYNLAHVGVLMPVSGAAKGEGALLSNGFVSLAVLFAPFIDLREFLTDYSGNRIAIGNAAFRVSELLVPAIMAVGFILIVLRRHSDKIWAPIVVGLAAAMIIKAFYNFVFVNYWHQSSWYFAFACGMISFISAILLSEDFNRWRRSAPVASRMVVTLVLFVSFLQASQGYFRKVGIGVSEENPQKMFFDARIEIENALREKFSTPKLLEFGDGLVNFSLSFPVRHGFVFAGDVGSLKALQSARLLEKSYADGYNILTSFEYIRWPDADETLSSDAIRMRLAGSFLDERVKAELDQFDFGVVYVYHPLNIPFIAFRPR